MKCARTWLFAAILAFGAGGVASAQPNCVQVGQAQLLFGPLTRSACELSPSVDGGEDYGWVSVRFSPPSVAPLIPKGASAAKWLRLLGNNQARRAFAIGEVKIIDGSTGAEISSASVPLAEFTFGAPDAQGAVAITPTAIKEVASDADRYVTPSFRIRDNTVIRVRIKLLYTNKDRTAVLEAINPYLTLAKEFGASGGVINKLTSANFATAVAKVESSLNALRQGQYESDVTADLRVAAGSANRIDYAFNTGVPQAAFKRGAPAATNMGMLQFAIERQPSAFSSVKKLRADGLPDYGLSIEPGTPQLNRFLGMRVAGQGGKMQSLNDYLLGKVPTAATLNDAATFEATAGKLIDALTAGDLDLSSHDAFAAYYLELMKSRALYSKTIQETNTVKRDLAQFKAYGFFVPTVQ